ncbi:MAG: hypothetical protein UZ07_CHB004001623 [Chlorobi bacterium OLB7]|nr:MAG: hypothetical protein UZ07_CHB004001623 [Chlorobi bacterium OLB7]
MPLLTSFNTIAGMFAGVVAHFGTSTKPAFQRKVAGKYADITYRSFTNKWKRLRWRSARWGFPVGTISG